jgi:hypothetical protein
MTTQDCIITFVCPVEYQDLEGARIPDEAEHHAHIKPWCTWPRAHHAIIPPKAYLMGRTRERRPSDGLLSASSSPGMPLALLRK